MKVEIGALVEKDYGPKVKDEVSQLDALITSFTQLDVQMICLNKSNSETLARRRL